jgi:hypothetical protein
MDGIRPMNHTRSVTWAVVRGNGRAGWASPRGVKAAVRQASLFTDPPPGKQRVQQQHVSRTHEFTMGLDVREPTQQCRGSSTPRIQRTVRDYNGLFPVWRRLAPKRVVSAICNCTHITVDCQLTAAATRSSI